ncbi:MAG: FMN-dependent NADH-azoreductase [Peptostreptococcaceae bacterium]
MSKVLFIKANPKPDQESNTFRLANVFMEAYKENNPNDEIITLDLYEENIKNLDGKTIEKIFSGEENEATKHAKLFAACDKYVIAAPMWNLSFPAILKSYIDYVSYVGITFKYTEEGAVGLLANQGKKAVHIVSRGGMYTEGPMKEFEMGDSYLRTILGFFGVYDVETIAFELTNVLKGNELEIARLNANEKAVKLAKEF